MNHDSMADTGDVRQAIRAAASGLLERDALVEVLFLAAIAGEHVLVVGPPGTAKSQVVRSVAHQLGGSYFEYLLGRFTEPNEIFGPVDLRKLREGTVEIETAGMLPEADIAFIDEVFLGSTAILNTLLGILNERVFRRGSTVVNVPLRLCVGASNTMPTDPSLAAFADRFLVRMFLEPVDDALMEDLLKTTWEAAASPEATSSALSLEHLDSLRAARQRCDLAAVRPSLAHAIRAMRTAGVPITDRRAVKAQSLVAAAAVLDGRATATSADLWPLPLIVPTNESQIAAREVLGPLLDDASNAVTPHAAELLSASRASRGHRLVERGQEVIFSNPGEAGDGMRLRREAVLREIDAAFSEEQLTPELRVVRERVVGLLGE
jgi:MoxR-like ATPase